MITYNVKLNFENIEESKRFYDTLEIQRKSWNFISNIVFEHNPSGIKEFHSLAYKEARTKFPELPAQYIIRSINDVKSTYQTIKSNKHIISKPCYKKSCSVRLDKRLYSIKGNSIFITSISGSRVKFNFNPYPKLESLLKNIIPCDPLLFIRDGQVWLSLSFKVPVKPVIENSVLGVDLGVNRLYSTSENNVWIDKNFKRKQRSIRYLKRTLQSKNTKSSKKKLKKLRRKEHNRTKSQCHAAVNSLLKTPANIIAIEDLTKIKQKTSTKNKKKGKLGKKQNNKLSQVPFYLFKTILQYKAELVGKRVVLVSPAFTSQNDYRGLKRGERIKTRYKGSDGVVLDADLNASMNIALKYASKHELPVSCGEFRVPALDGQVVVNQPNVCKSNLSKLVLQASML